MAVSGQAIARHLVFVLEDNTVVVQRGANLVEVLETREQRFFDSSDHHHNVTDKELLKLFERQLITNFDDVTVWLPQTDSRKAEVGKARYFFLDTKLSTPYLKIVQSLLKTTDLRQNYVAKVYYDRVAIVDMGGDPFNNLNDAEAALTLLKQALGKQLIGLTVDTVTIDTSIYDTQVMAADWQKELIHATPKISLANSTVLIIEDDVSFVQQLEMALENLPLEVMVAGTGEAAFELIMDVEPDLILLAMVLPDMHGYQVVAKIKKDPLMARTPIIAFSDHPSETDMVFALYVAQVDDYIVRPIQPRLIRQRVVNLLMGYGKGR